MRNIGRVCLWFLLPVLAAFPADAAGGSDNKATIAVLPFELGQMPDTRTPIETSVLTDVFNRVLVTSRKFRVVDRKQLDRIRREQRFGHSGLADTGTRARVGKILGAQFLVIGTVQDYSISSPHQMAYGSGWTRPVRISVEIQVVDSSTGEIVSARKSEGRAQTRISSPNAAGSIPREALEIAAEQIADEALLRILDIAYPVKVVDVAGTQIRLNRGEGAGIEVGNVLRCFSAGKKLYDPDTKEYLGTSETEAGRIRVTEVLAKLSVAQVLAGKGFAPGNACRMDEYSADEAGKHRAPPPKRPVHSY